jgi:hypothetical protein
VTPISPLYTISGVEGMAPSPVILKIPAMISDDSFAMGFFYDASSGQLEGMPLLAEDGTSVTVATEHFSSVFVSAVKKALLPPTVDSGFRPGVDDWQFVNYGSYVANGGHCAGQVLTEAWYYTERHLKAGAEPLYGLYDDNGEEATPRRWQDDSYGYRLASVAQSQYEANQNKFLTFFASWMGKRFDVLQYNAFRYGIAVTGEPQLIGITDANNRHGHAILAYRVSPTGIFVADPNYPAAWRLVPYDTKTGKFGAYSSGENAAAIAVGNDVSYTNFTYFSKKALVDWPALAADWTAFDAGTIGHGMFPTYLVEARAGQDTKGKDVWVPLVDGYQTTDKSLTLRIRDPKGVDAAQMEVFPGFSSTHAAPKGGQATINLDDGENRLGIYEEGKKPAWSKGAYVDFVWLTVTRGPAPKATLTATPAVGGRWVLTSPVERLDPPYESDTTKVSRSSSNGRFTVSESAKPLPPALPLQLEGSMAWGPPPASAAAGDTWATNLSVTANCGSGPRFSANVRAEATYGAGPYLKSQFWEVASSCGDGAQAKQLSWAFPTLQEAHLGPASALSISVQAWAISGEVSVAGDVWTYTYQWQP